VNCGIMEKLIYVMGKYGNELIIEWR
jgi:galactokinase